MITRRSAMDEVLAATAPKGLSGDHWRSAWDFAALIAAGYRFIPQPSFQQYSSYTPRLRKKMGSEANGGANRQRCSDRTPTRVRPWRLTSS